MDDERLVCFISIEEWRNKIADIKTLCGKTYWINDAAHSHFLSDVTCPDCQNTYKWKVWFASHTAQRMMK